MAFRRYIQRTLKEHGIGITFEMLQVLSCLWRDQGIAQQTLAERIIKDASDRRNKLVYLTPAGEALWQRLLPILDDVYNQAEQIIGPERIRTLSEELEEIHNRLENA